MIRTTTNSGLQEFVTDRVLRRYSPIPFAGWLAAKRAHGLSSQRLPTHEEAHRLDASTALSCFSGTALLSDNHVLVLKPS